MALTPTEQIAAAIASSLNEISAHARNMRDGAGESINGFYREAKRYVRSFDEKRGLRYRPATIQLSASIGSVAGAGVVSSGNDEFRVSNDEDFLVQSVRGFIMSSAFQLEPGGGAFANALTTTLTPQQVLLLKAQNCTVSLINKDTKLPVMENELISLASITPEVGGQPLKFGPDALPGFIIPHNMNMQVFFALQSVNLVFNTVPTVYGIALTGLYLSREVRG